MDIYIVYNDSKILKKLGDTKLKVSPFFHFIDERTLHGRKQAFKLKGAWSARLSPFILCTEKDKPIKAFYSETGNDIIKSLIDYLNEQNIYS